MQHTAVDTLNGRLKSVKCEEAILSWRQVGGTSRYYYNFEPLTHVCFSQEFWTLLSAQTHTLSSTPSRLTASSLRRWPCLMMLFGPFLYSRPREAWGDRWNSNTHVTHRPEGYLGCLWLNWEGNSLTVENYWTGDSGISTSIILLELIFVPQNPVFGVSDTVQPSLKARRPESLRNWHESCTFEFSPRPTSMLQGSIRMLSGGIVLSNVWWRLTQ